MKKLHGKNDIALCSLSLKINVKKAKRRKKEREFISCINRPKTEEGVLSHPPLGSNHEGSSWRATRWGSGHVMGPPNTAIKRVHSSCRQTNPHVDFMVWHPRVMNYDQNCVKVLWLRLPLAVLFREVWKFLRLITRMLWLTSSAALSASLPGPAMETWGEWVWLH